MAFEYSVVSYLTKVPSCSQVTCWSCLGLWPLMVRKALKHRPSGVLGNLLPTYRITDWNMERWPDFTVVPSLQHSLFVGEALKNSGNGFVAVHSLEQFVCRSSQDPLTAVRGKKSGAASHQQDGNLETGLVLVSAVVSVLAFVRTGSCRCGSDGCVPLQSGHRREPSWKLGLTPPETRGRSSSIIVLLCHILMAAAYWSWTLLADYDWCICVGAKRRRKPDSQRGCDCFKPPDYSFKGISGPKVKGATLLQRV